MMFWFRRMAQAVVAALFSWSSVAGIYEDFFAAMERSDAGAVVRMLAQGFDVNSPNPTGQRPLHLAARAGSSALVDALLAAPDVKVDAPNAALETPLMLAALGGHLDICQKLAQRGAAVKREGWTPLHYAASGPSTTTLAFLLELGASIEAPSPNGTTPLMMAARYGAEPSAALLLQRGADPRARNQQNLSAADFARLAGREALAQRLDAAASR